MPPTPPSRPQPASSQLPQGGLWDLPSLFGQMKELEKQSLAFATVPSDCPWFMRLDGTSFSPFTARLHKPYDVQFLRAMVHTMNDLIRKFHATCGYTQSDEITLIFRPLEASQVLPYGGRAPKLLSIVAAYASARFNFHIQRCVLADGTYGRRARAAAAQGDHVFDNRIVVCRDPENVLRHQIWRAAGDCQRNSVNSFACKLLRDKGLEGVKQGELKRRMAARGLRWEHVPTYCKKGVWAKHVEVEVKGYNPAKKVEVTTQRKRIANFTLDIRRCANVDWILGPTLPRGTLQGHVEALGLGDPDIREIGRRVWHHVGAGAGGGAGEGGAMGLSAGCGNGQQGGSQRAGGRQDGWQVT